MTLHVHMKTMKFAANVSTLCQDFPKLVDRLTHIASRRDHSFEYIESQNPYSEDLDTLKSLSEQFNFKWVLINTPPLFQVYKPSHVLNFGYFKPFLDKSIDYAKGLKCPTVHVVLGDLTAEKPDNLTEMINILKESARVMKGHGITAVIEPLSNRSDYYLKSYDQAVSIVDDLKQDNLKIMLDTFHLQKLHGNLSEYIDKKIPREFIGHVQVSQTPLRDCPMHAGEVNHAYILKKISKVYDGVVGLEYNSKSEDSFSWLNDFHEIWWLSSLKVS